jgi:monoamine oxidase
MTTNHFDTIIVGAGMAGLYAAYLRNCVRRTSSSFLVLEKQKSLGGRAGNDTFFGAQVVTGAGIGRKSKDKLLYRLLQDLGVGTTEYMVKPRYSPSVLTMNLKQTMELLRKEFHKRQQPQPPASTFKQFATSVLGKSDYDNFVVSSGYSDYENEDAHETLFFYGMEDNACCWKAFTVPWHDLVTKLYETIGPQHFKLGCGVASLRRTETGFLIKTDTSLSFTCNQCILATAIDTIQKLLPKMPIYKRVRGQPFLRVYAKFDKASIPLMREAVPSFTVVPPPLQHVIPMNADLGVYMIAYCDNKNATSLPQNNTKEVRDMYVALLEKFFGISGLHILAIKNYFWQIGTHYYAPLDAKKRPDFLRQIQHPDTGLFVVGEAVSRNQGWVEGALESVLSIGLS